MLPVRYKVVVLASEALRRGSRVVPGLTVLLIACT